MVMKRDTGLPEYKGTCLTKIIVRIIGTKTPPIRGQGGSKHPIT